MSYSKYRAVKTKVDGITFDSKKEAQRYIELKLLESTGEIDELDLQPKFKLMKGFRYKNKKIRDIDYIADFRYTDVKTGKRIVEDVKGVKTDVYKIKMKLFLNIFGNDYDFYEV